MDTSLQRVNFSTDTASIIADQEVADAHAEEEHHIHLPNPSFWPLILGAAVFVVVAGLLFIPDNPWLSIMAAPFVLLGIVGWAVEDPMGGKHGETAAQPHSDLTPEQVLDMAREVVDRNVTISSTAYSTHPVTVEIDEIHENGGIVLALYGKVELEAQRQQVEDELWQLPNVVMIKNFVVAEDAILHLAEERINTMRQKGKLEGARNISVLVENYILHLYGETPDNDMKYALERELIGIPGVRVVVNHIGLNEDIPGNLGKTRNKI